MAAAIRNTCRAYLFMKGTHRNFWVDPKAIMPYLVVVANTNLKALLTERNNVEYSMHSPFTVHLYIVHYYLVSCQY